MIENESWEKANSHFGNVLFIFILRFSYLFWKGSLFTEATHKLPMIAFWS